MSSANTCIFCGRDALDDHCEHVIPESLGGTDADILPGGLVCKSCNAYFGSKVEQRALASFPFNVWRVFSGIPTKKGKGASLPVIQGLLRGTGVGGVVGIDPASPHFDAGIRDGRITRMTVVASVTDPAAVCQMLLKIGLEIIAINNADIARSSRYDPARHTARSPRRGARWSFSLRANVDKFWSHIQQGCQFEQSLARMDVDVSEADGFPGMDFVHLRWPGIDLICPLDPHDVDAEDWRANNVDVELYDVLFGPRANQ